MFLSKNFKVFVFFILFQNVFCFFEKRNKKIIGLSSISLIILSSYLISKKIKKTKPKKEEEKIEQSFKSINDEVFHFINESYEKINECNKINKTEKNDAIISILNFSLPVIYINESNYNKLFIINDNDIWINLSANDQIKKLLLADIKNYIKNENFKNFINDLIDQNQYLYSIHFQYKDSYKDQSYDFFMNKIFKQTFEELKETYSNFCKKNSINLFIKYAFSTPDHCFPYRRRCLIDASTFIKDGGIRDFKACFEDDLEIRPIIISKFKEYNDNQYKSYEDNINNIYIDFIDDLIELSTNNNGNFQNYTNNNFTKKEDYIIFQIKFKDESKQKIGYINIKEKKLYDPFANPYKFEIKKEGPLFENDFKNKIKSIIEEYKELLNKDDGIKIDQNDLKKLQQINEIQQNKNKNLLERQNFKKKIYDELENIKKNDQSSKKTILDLITEVNENKLLTNEEKNYLINNLK